jgi:osmotically-inducible protein OsmY
MTTRRILERLRMDSVASQQDLDVRVTSSVAIVSGRVPSRKIEASVLALVAGTDGVLDVINNVTLTDDAIVQSVRAAIASDPLVKDVPVSVVCREGEVTLSSNQTNAAQRDRLVKLTDAIDGVEHVVDAMK